MITNLDIALNNYYLFCRDRNHHGGSIVIYIRSHVIALVIPLPSVIELLLLSVKFKHCLLTASTYYRPPSSPHDLDNLLDVLSSFNPSIFLNFILLGDFNVNYYCTSPLKLKKDAISNSFNLQQIVNDPTHFSYSSIPSTIDLVIILSTIEISSCVLPPVSFSDHNSILFAIPLKSHITTTPTTPHKVWLYNQADFVRANSLLCSIDWLQVLPSSDPNASWIIFKELFLLITNCTIPSKLTFQSNKSSLPWINHSYLKRVKTRNSLFMSAKNVAPQGCGRNINPIAMKPLLILGS